MRLIKPYYEILTPINGEEILKQIELAARTCYQSEEKIEYSHISTLEKDDEDRVKHRESDVTRSIIFGRENSFKSESARILIPKLMNLNHEAMLEFGGMITVRFIVDRGVTHELVRHRLCSFAQESTRYCNYGKDEHITFIIPSWLSENFKYNGYDANDTSNEYEWATVMANAEESYNQLIKHGWTPQQARSVLPNSLKSEINISANIREWRHIFKLRTAKAAHPSMREVMIPLLLDFKSKIPILFDDINIVE